MTPQKITPEAKPKNHPIRDFFWFCSGGNPDVLLNCPKSEHIRYASIGATVLFTGILAGISSAYAFYTIFQTWVGASVLGIIWGSMIFNLDRYIVSTMKKDGRWREWSQAMPRLGLALLLAFTISKPLELKLFEQEINQQLEEQKQLALDEVEETAIAKIGSLKSEVAQLKSDLKDKLASRDRYYDEYRCECDGTCGSGIRGRGRECGRKERKYQQMAKEYEELKLSTQQNLATLEAEISAIRKRKNNRIENTETLFATGLLARLEALNQLPFGPSLAILLLIIAIETAPILTKLLAPKGPYDDQMKALEHSYAISSLENINTLNQQLNKKLTLLEQLDQSEIEHELSSNKEVMQAVSNAYMGLVQEQLNDWLREQRQGKVAGKAENKWPKKQKT